MNKPDINRSILRMHIAAIEAKHPIKIIGLLPRGSVGHVFEDNALDFLAEKRPGLRSLGTLRASKWTCPTSSVVLLVSSSSAA